MIKCNCTRTIMRMGAIIYIFSNNFVLLGSHNLVYCQLPTQYTSGLENVQNNKQNTCHFQLLLHTSNTCDGSFK